MALSADEDLVELIYATAIDPMLWTDVMSRLADRLGGARATLTRFDVGTSVGEQFAARADPDALAAYAAYYHSVNCFARRKDPGGFLLGWRPHVATECSVLPWEAYQASEFCNDYVLPQGYNAQMFVRLHLEGRMATTLNIGRAPGRGRFEGGDLQIAESYLPHLVRAHRMGRSFAGIGPDLAATIHAAAEPMIVADDKGRVRLANAAAERLLRLDRGLGVHGGRLAAGSPDSSRTLDRLIGEATRGDGARQGGAMRLPPTAIGQALALRVLPLGVGALPALGRPGLAAIAITDPDAELQAPQDALKEIFGLTAAEARLASAVFDGLSLSEAADRFGVSINTVRFQLARVFDKTGVTRQAELVKLMMRLAGPARLQPPPTQHHPNG